MGSLSKCVTHAVFLQVKIAWLDKNGLELVFLVNKIQDSPWF